MAAACPESLHYLFAFYFWGPDATDDIEVVCEAGTGRVTAARLRRASEKANNLVIVEDIALARMETSADGQRGLYCTVTRTPFEKLVIVEADNDGHWRVVGRHSDEAAARAVLLEAGPVLRDAVLV